MFFYGRNIFYLYRSMNSQWVRCDTERNSLLDRYVLKTSVLGPIILVVRSLAFADIHSHMLAMVFARRLAASPSVDARPPHLMWKDSQMPRWHGYQKAAMGRTVVSPITMAHLFGISVICRFKSFTQHALGQKCDSSFALTRQFRIKICKAIIER